MTYQPKMFQFRLASEIWRRLSRFVPIGIVSFFNFFRRLRTAAGEGFVPGVDGEV